MFRSEHNTSTVKSGLSMFSSICLFTFDMNFQSRLLEQVVVVEGSSSVLISKSAYLLRSNARLASRLAMLAFSMFMLKESREQGIEQGIEKKRWQHGLRGVKSQKYYDMISAY